jgi:hypothetical protein
MSSPVEICSNALILVGASPIASLSETSDRAIVVSNLYDQVRRATLRRHLWNFAMTRELLSPDSTPPAFEWSNAFTLPGDCLRLVSIGEKGEHPDYTLEGRKILSNDSSIKLGYVSDVSDVSQFDAMFIDALCANIAFTAAWPITKSESMQKAMWTLYQSKIQEARTIDGVETPPGEIDSSYLLDARRASGYPTTT